MASGECDLGHISSISALGPVLQVKYLEHKVVLSQTGDAWDICTAITVIFHSTNLVDIADATPGVTDVMVCGAASETRGPGKNTGSV